ncbi:MAG TPA: hypothetical protein VNU68_34810 [Verrucomicrobiae bacterium]|nr:hypothetical protein [Verrucomicrobiae bacterium]
MKQSKVIAVEFDPIFKRIWITRLWLCGVRSCRGYRHNNKRVTSLWRHVGGWVWEQTNGVTTLRQ